MNPHLFVSKLFGRNRLFFVVLLSLSVLVSLNVKAQEFSRWEETISKFEAADEEKAPPKNAVLFLGSSSIRMWKSVAEDFPKHRVINRGFGGSTLPDCIHFFDRLVKPYAPSTIVFYEGDNDMGRGDSADTVYANFKTFAKLVKEHFPETRIIFIAIKPSIKRWNLAPEMKKANWKIQRYAWLHENIEFADIWDPMLGKDGKPRPELFLKDGLHMTAEGYQIWTKVVAGEL